MAEMVSVTNKHTELDHFTKTKKKIATIDAENLRAELNLEFGTNL